MCGIAGIFAYHPDAPNIDYEELLRIRDAMAVRGPDGAGAWVSPDNRTALAHRRLAIIGLDASGAQPMSASQRGLHVTFNGEIYNYRELRATLQARGYRFSSETDTEVLLHLYTEHGARMVEHLRGMYAFAIYDEPRRCLFLARDPFGVKPLYLADDGKTLRFASQVKALLKSRAIDASPAAAGHVGFYLWGHVPEPHTLYRGIKALPAGCSITVMPGRRHETAPFFDIGSELAKAHGEQEPGAHTACATLRSALLESVRYHMVADVPVGVFLSSGLDSSTLTALAAEIHGGRLRTLTLGFEEYRETAADETTGALKVAERYGTDHVTSWIRRRDFEDELGRVLEAMDQPSIDGLNTYFVSRAAARCGLKVALSGLGADELFGGYPAFREIPRSVQALALARHVPQLARVCRRLAAPAVARFTSPKYAGLLEYGGSYAGAYLLRRGLFMPWELPAIVGRRFAAEGLAELATLPRLAESLRGLRSPRDRVSALELTWYMRNQLLRDADWAGMAHSLEIRVPFVDVPLFRAVASLSNREPLSKQDMASTPALSLPKELLGRAKTGFTVPIKAWLAQTSHGAARGLRGWACAIQPPVFRSADVLALVPEAFGGRGGIAQYDRDFLTALSAHRDVSEVVLLPRLVREPPGAVPPKIRHVTDGLPGKLAYVKALARVLRTRRNFDLIVCGHVNLLPLAYAAHIVTGARLVLLLYGIEAWKPPRSALVRAAARRVSAYISISRITEERFRTWAGTSASGYVLPNAVDLSAYGVNAARPGLARSLGVEGKRVLMTLGRLSAAERYKGFDEVLEVLPVLSRKVPDLVYIIAGEGDDRERLARKAANLGISDRVIFTGFVDESEKAELYRLADVYVHASRGEGFGFTILEALASGIPTIASRLDGGREAVRAGQLGALVDPGEPHELEAAILDALRKPKAIPTGIQYFSGENFQKRLHGILDEIFSGGARGSLASEQHA